uniref:Oxidoreductase n=1 Tax=Macrostomum lignano TaxID=282301 RepID=A0A1I8JRD0_9PLAT
MKDDQIAELMKKSERTVTVTVMPTFVYKHIVSCMGKSLVRKWMDHSIGSTAWRLSGAALEE